ncbi:MAG: hypothetical protein K0S65_6247 [Labilithrix sp.]|nr:hypothetical protein [Labilithrix sp.]
MKIDDIDPPRLDEASELAKLVRASRSRRPSPRATAEMAKRLAATSSASRGPGFLGRAGTAKLGVLALIGLGSALFAWRTKTVEPVVSVGTAADLSVEVASPSPASPSPASPPNMPAFAAEPPSISVDALPSSAKVVAVAPPTPRAIAPRPTSSSPSPVTAPAGEAREARPAPAAENEFALVRRAQDALPSDPSHTLSLVDEHVRAFPAGELVQEREVLAVEALARLHRMEEAKRRAKALLGLYPRTPYVARLERALGETLPAAALSNAH